MGITAFAFLRWPLPFVALLFPLVMGEAPLFESTGRWTSFLNSKDESAGQGKYMAMILNIGTSAYLNLRKVSTVKKLLELVLRLLIADLLGSDDRVATTSDVLEASAIEDLYASAQRVNELAVLQLICSLRDCCAACAE